MIDASGRMGCGGWAVVRRAGGVVGENVLRWSKVCVSMPAAERGLAGPGIKFNAGVARMEVIVREAVGGRKLQAWAEVDRRT